MSAIDKLPIDNINICILGTVSAGKSTILNTLFCEDLSETKIKRTTMMPTYFVERNNNMSLDKEINEIIKKKNNEIIKQTEKNTTLNLKNHGDQLIFNINKIHVQISKRYNVTLLDMPGLNDAKTKDEFYRYLNNNFNLFNIVIFVVNIESGLNTSDEMDILNNITSNMKKYIKRDIRLLVIANKADDMQYDSNEKRAKIVNEELNEMFTQIHETVVRNLRDNKMIDKLIDIIPICAIDSHLFMMLTKFGNKYVLTPSQIQRIGISEIGNRFRSYTEEKKKETIERVLSDKDFIETMIKLSGFKTVIDKLNKCIDSYGEKMISNNILRDIDIKLDIDNIIYSLKPILNNYVKLINGNETIYKEKMNELVKIITTNLTIKINKLTNVEVVQATYANVIFKIYHCEDLINLPSESGFLNMINETIFNTKTKKSITMKELFEPYIDFYHYPAYVQKKTLDLIKLEFSNKSFSISKLLYFNILDQVKILNKQDIEDLLKIIINNPQKTNTIIFDNETIKFKDNILSLFNKLKIADNFIEFLQFFLRTDIKLMNWFIY